MCTQPLYIRNPYVRSFSNEHLKQVNVLLEKSFIVAGEVKKSSSALFSHKPLLKVPCGKCAECRQTYYNSIFQRAVVESRSSYMFFITLTYDDKHIPALDIGGHTFYYADYTHIQNMFKRLRKYNVIGREFRYLCVNEYGDSKLRPHWHLLLFVSKDASDTECTPYELEKKLYDNLQEFYSINIGTSRKPIYEKLFTYAQSYDAHGNLRSNFYCKYVDIEHTEESETTYKTINYLIGYVNKPQRIDDLLDYYLKSYSDPVLVSKIRQRLSSKVRYSKGFGFGFVNGHKNYMQPLFSNISSRQRYMHYLDEQLPTDYETFKLLYPLWNDQVDLTLSTYDWQSFANWDDMYMNIDIRIYSYLYIAHKYKMPCLSSLRCLSPQRLTPTIRYHFEFGKKINHTMVYTKTYVADTTNPVWQHIRKGLDFGLKNHLSFMPFVYGGQVQSLCRFYRRCCTDDIDILRMYEACGVKNFDEWQQKYERDVVNSNSSTRQKSHVVSHENFVFQHVKAKIVKKVDFFAKFMLKKLQK